jgi:hypothetical protein
MSRAHLDRRGEVRAHAHRQQLQSIARGDLRKQGKVRGGCILGRRNAHQARNRQTEIPGAGRDEGIGLAWDHTGLLRLLARIDLNEQRRRTALLFD